ncbi:VOC family protein [Haloarchaeobius sp. TZWWS8]|uniref:VOC family protein n=1 Tax=Haloarchaeobius sp. TZWWS8 TaxID=3446121 RepID=UPI003EBA48B9
MDLRLDHVPTAWQDGAAAVAAIESVGLPTSVGGEHADGTTEMYVVGFPDGSYLELITNTGEETPSRWPAFIAGDAGPCAWCLDVDDIRAFMKQTIDADLHVSGPDRDGRERPDGVYVEWETATVGDHLGLTHPFAIEDRTPRRYRVAPDPALDEGPLVGLSEVVVLTDEPAPLVDDLDRWLGVPRQQVLDRPEFGARLRRFPGAPVAVATPTGDRLENRLARFGPAVCAVLVETTSLDAAAERFDLTDPREWGSDAVAWFDHPDLHRRVGVVEYGH